MENYLVTGGAGFIGANICRRLVRDGFSVRVVDNFLTGHKSNMADFRDKIDFIEGDIGNRETAKKAVDGIDVILHQAALPSVPRSVDDPATTHQNCVNATFTLLVAARDAKVRRFVYAASSSAYGDSPTLPKVETMTPNPLSPYAAAKLCGEYYCSVFSTVYGLETISLRYFNVFGPYQDPTSQYAAAIPAFVTKILSDTPPLVYGDGEQSRDFTYVDNIVHANILAANASKTAGQAINIACGQRITVNEIIRQINSILGKRIQPRYVPSMPGDVRHSLASIAKAKELIGFEPVVSFEDGLAQAIQWYRKNIACSVQDQK